MIIANIPSEAAFTLSPRSSMLSQTAEYALRTVLYLAAGEQDTLFRVSEIAEELDVPRNYLSKTLHLLARAGVLTSSRGKHGGFRLTKPPSKLTLAEVVAPFDGPTGARICLLGRTACSDSDPCPAHGTWKAVSTRGLDVLPGNDGGRPAAGAGGARAAETRRRPLDSRHARPRRTNPQRLERPRRGARRHLALQPAPRLDGPLHRHRSAPTCASSAPATPA